MVAHDMPVKPARRERWGLNLPRATKPVLAELALFCGLTSAQLAVFLIDGLLSNLGGAADLYLNERARREKGAQLAMSERSLIMMAIDRALAVEFTGYARGLEVPNGIAFAWLVDFVAEKLPPPTGPRTRSVDVSALVDVISTGRPSEPRRPSSAPLPGQLPLPVVKP
jgi:hypothetical protein